MTMLRFSAVINSYDEDVDNLKFRYSWWQHWTAEGGSSTDQLNEGLKMDKIPADRPFNCMARVPSKKGKWGVLK